MVRLLRAVLCLAPLTVAVAAAGPASSLSAATEGLAPLGEPTATRIVAHVQTTMFEPAPVPNPDASGPSSVIDPKSGLGPRLFSSKNEFEGDGFSGTSSEAATIDARKQPAAGLGFNVPVTSSPR